MIFRKWLKALAFGLGSTLFVMLYLFLQLHYSKPYKEEIAKAQHSSVSNVLEGYNFLPSNWTKIPMSMNKPVNKEKTNQDVLKTNNMHTKERQTPRDVPREVEHTNDFDGIHLALACCLNGQKSDNQQITLTKTFLKSLFTFNKNGIHLHVFVSKSFSRPVETLVNSFKTNSTSFEASFYHSSMPEMDNIVVKEGPIGVKNVSLENLFKPCSAQRLFLPYNLRNLDKVVYMDTDTLVLGPITDMWRSFSLFNSSQLYGMTFIARHPGFYDKRPFPMPYKGLTGHNAGVMLMHLKRMREIGWNDIAIDIISELSGPGWAFASDQDVLNYYNGLHPDDVYEMSCAYNWRWSYCLTYKGLPQECEDAHYHGITIMHGVSGTFFKQSNFLMRIYRIFVRYEYETSIEKYLIAPMKDALVKYKDYLCGSVNEAYYKKMVSFSETI